MFDGLGWTPFLYRNHSWSHHWSQSSCDAGDARAADYWCVVLFPSWQIVVESPDRCAGLVGNYKTKVLFEKADSDENGETEVLQNRMHPSQQKFYDFLGTHISMPIIILYTFKLNEIKATSIQLRLRIGR